jgi:class 3 adenylate cyclase
MAVQPTLLLIADIAGYTRFMKFHFMSLVHAQEIVARLLEAVIDAASPALRLAKLEGDAAFFYLPCASDGSFEPEIVARHAAAIHRAFHARVADLKANTLCPCDGCQQTGDLKIKLVGHVGDVAVQKVKQFTELAGVDVIVVHRMLKNDVPLPEYLLVTKPVYEMLDAPLKASAQSVPLVLEGLGDTDAYYVDLQVCAAAAPPAAVPLPWLPRLARHFQLIGRSVPYILGLRKACTDFRNVPQQG